MLQHYRFYSKSPSDDGYPKWIMMVLVLIVVTAFNIGGINDYTIRRDELTTLGHIGALQNNNDGISIASTVESLSFYSSDHSPIYYAIANIWGHFVEFNYFAIRMLSAWFGMITVAGTYWIGRHFISHAGGVVSAFLLGTNIIFYANFHEMREWSMMLMFSVLTLIAYLRLAYIRKPLKFVDLLPLFITVVLSLYTNYLTIFVLVAIGVHHLLFIPKTKGWWQISLTVIFAGVMFIPWLPTVLNGVAMLQEQQSSDQQVYVANAELLSLMPIFWGNGIALLFGSGIGLGIASLVIGWRKAICLFAFCVVITLSFLLTNEVLAIVKRIRYLLLWTLPVALLIGSGLGLLTRTKFTMLILIIFVGVWIGTGANFIQTTQFNDALSKDRAVRYPEYNGLVPLLHDQTEKRDLLIVAQYESSVLNRSKQGLISIQEYYLNPLKLTITNFPQYSQWAGSGIEADSVEYAMGLVPGRDEFWLAYHHTQITDDVTRFREQVEQDFQINSTTQYGLRSTLIHYVANDDEICDVTAFRRSHAVMNRSSRLLQDVEAS